MSKLNLRQAREKAGVSVEFVAEQMGVSVSILNCPLCQGHFELV